MVAGAEGQATQEAAAKAAAVLRAVTVVLGETVATAAAEAEMGATAVLEPKEEAPGAVLAVLEAMEKLASNRGSQDTQGSVDAWAVRVARAARAVVTLATWEEIVARAAVLVVPGAVVRSNQESQRRQDTLGLMAVNKTFEEVKQ